MPVVVESSMVCVCPLRGHVVLQTGQAPCHADLVSVAVPSVVCTYMKSTCVYIGRACVRVYVCVLCLFRSRGAIN